MDITTIGLDLAKSVSHVVCCNQAGKIVRKKMLRRTQILHFLVSYHPVWWELSHVPVRTIGREK